MLDSEIRMSKLEESEDDDNNPAIGPPNINIKEMEREEVLRQRETQPRAKE